MTWFGRPNRFQRPAFGVRGRFGSDVTDSAYVFYASAMFYALRQFQDGLFAHAVNECLGAGIEYVQVTDGQVIVKLKE